MADIIKLLLAVTTGQCFLSNVKVNDQFSAAAVVTVAAAVAVVVAAAAAAAAATALRMPSAL